MKFVVSVQGGVVVNPEDEKIEENQNAEFNCESKSVPPLPVQWRRLSKVDSECKTGCKFVEHNVVQNERVTIQGGKLSFKKAKPEDKGRYTCVAGLNSEFVSKNVTFNVVGK